MRCIEILSFPPSKKAPSWLTLTWDVLKCFTKTEELEATRLTLTWDVLKLT